MIARIITDLPARKLLGIAAAEKVGIEADLGEELAHDLPRRLPARAMRLGRVGDRGLDRQARVQGRGAVLEHHLEIPPHVAQRDAANAADPLAIENDLAGIAVDFRPA
ncbi:MAG TPA: hypothetical protein VFR34_14270 [Paracoccaceae bacterium]|nr:hypothetical protein [Paracoccaceae bacterium]